MQPDNQILSLSPLVSPISKNDGNCETVNCSNPIDPRNSNYCFLCNKQYCHVCNQPCSECGKKYCPTCYIYYCPKCQKGYCSKTCFQICCHCFELFCQDCYPDHTQHFLERPIRPKKPIRSKSRSKSILKFRN